MTPRIAAVFAAGSILAATVPHGWAQAIDPSRLAEGARPLNVPSLIDEPDTEALGLDEDNAFAPESPGDDDLGQQLILKESARLRWLYFTADTFSYWTDNPANVSEDTEDDFFWGARVSLGAQPRIAGRLFLDGYLGQQIYRYDRFDVLDYEFFEANLGLIYPEPLLWDATLFAQALFNRMTTDNFGDTVYESWSVRAGIQKSFVFDRRNSVHVNLMGDWDVDIDVDALKRSEYIADLAYQFKLMRDLVVLLSYRFTWFDYREIDRTDYLNLVGASLTWSPKPWLDVYLAATFSDNESDFDVFDYRAVNTGGGLGVRVRF